jgi:peptidoglycan lytic transglycosylase G
LRFLLKLFLLSILAVAVWLGYGLLLPTGPSGEKFVLLRPGSSARSISQKLRNEGVIRCSWAFLLLHGLKLRSLKAGEYRFDQPANALDVYDRIARGDIYVHTVVIPEGYNMFDVANTIEMAGLGSKQDFLKIARDPAPIRDIAPEAPSLEGYLFPDTYEFTRTQSLRDIAVAMTRRFRQEAKTIGLSSDADDIHRIVTMASIVEKETAVPEERPTVAGVYFNRLTRHMGLDADPSVAYAALLAGRYTGVIHASDLQYDSPYNTYKYVGLPPGPIANPGRSALQAAMHPVETDFLYFVSDNQGHHRFAKSLEEHSRNVAAYRRGQGGR